MSLLDDITARLTALPEDKRKAAVDLALKQTAHMKWIPNPGPQTEAFNCIADQLLYGGEVGGGKTDLLIGSGIERHQRSLILRRINKEVAFLAERTEEILGTRDGFNGQQNRWHLSSGQMIQFGGCQHSGDEKSYKGDPKDLIGVDEASEFLESMIEFLVGWLRSADPAQRCQLILATNPPTTAEGQWIVAWFAPWIDPTHPLYPYPQGKLLWVVRDGKHWRWLHKPDAVDVNGRLVKPISRTFIRSGLKDNPDYAKTDYADRLGNMREDLRRRYQDGDFSAGMHDQENQVIPSAWVVAAQERWRPDGGKSDAMSAMALDPAGGGKDSAEIACRHAGWYAQMVSAQGPETADGSTTAATVTKHRKNACPIVVDVGGGYAGAVILRLKDNNIPYRSFNGANTSTAKTKDKQLRFYNMRAEAWWKFAEELDPDQEGGSVIALPPDPELLGDLSAPTYTVTAKGILLESKDEIRKRLGRSTGKGDAVVMALSEGNRALARARSGNYDPVEQGYTTKSNRPSVNMGRDAARRA